MSPSLHQPPVRTVSLRRNLVLLVLVCLGPALVLFGFNAVENHQLFRSRLQSETIRLAEVFVSDIDRELASIESGLKVLATSSALANGDLAQFHAIAKAAVKSQIVYNYILTDGQGLMLMNTLVPYGNPLPKRGTPGQLARVFSSKQPVLTDYFIGPVTGKGAIAVGVPVFNEAGEVKYSLNVGLAPEKLAEILQKRPMTEGWLAALIDTSGIIVGRTRDEKAFIGTKAIPELLANISLHRNGTMDTFTKEGIPVATAFASSSKWGWTVAVGAPKALVEAQLKKSALYTALTVCVMLLLAGWVSAKVIRHLTQSLAHLNDAALTLMQGKPIEMPRVNLLEAQAVGQAMMKASELASEVHFLAYHDSLTHLANRPLFFEFLENSLARARRSGTAFSLLALDLDNFKKVNDQDGHAAGDALLKEAAQRMTEMVREADLVARLGGDEFAILLMNTDPQAARVVADRLCKLMSKPYAASKVAVSASVGVAHWQPDVTSAEAMLERADQALYRAKEMGRNTCCEASES